MHPGVRLLTQNTGCFLSCQSMSHSTYLQPPSKRKLVGLVLAVLLHLVLLWALQAGLAQKWAHKMPDVVKAVLLQDAPVLTPSPAPPPPPLSAPRPAPPHLLRPRRPHLPSRQPLSPLFLCPPRKCPPVCPPAPPPRSRPSAARLLPALPALRAAWHPHQRPPPQERAPPAAQRPP